MIGKQSSLQYEKIKLELPKTSKTGTVPPAVELN